MLGDQPFSDAKILVVDDTLMTLKTIEIALSKLGYLNLFFARSATEAFTLLENQQGIDLVLMDILMEDVDGIEACDRLKKDPRWSDVPVIMVTAVDEVESLSRAFAVGAIDYVTKPFHETELQARVSSTLRLKREIDQRKERERQLMRSTARLTEANQSLLRHSLLDELTGVPNRRAFNESFDEEWRRALRNSEWLGLLAVDIDHFKEYNDTYGHQAGDECLRRLAAGMTDNLHRAGDLLARVGGEEFMVLLPRTDPEGARALAESLRRAVEDLAIPHERSRTAKVVTASVGVASVRVEPDADRKEVVQVADDALYTSKRGGRNRITLAPVKPSVGDGSA